MLSISRPEQLTCMAVMETDENSNLTENDNKKWYVVYTKPRAEVSLEKILEKKGIETYLPMITRKRKWSDRIKDVTSPILPSYIFVHIDYQKSKLDVLRSAGAVHFLEVNHEPEIVDENAFNTFREWMTEYPETIKAAAMDKIRPGNIITIGQGAFAGYRARVIKRKNKSEIYMKIFGNQSIQITVNLDCLKLED